MNEVVNGSVVGCHKNKIRITKLNLKTDANVENFARFQVDMAMESEGLALDYERVRRGV